MKRVNQIEQKGLLKDFFAAARQRKLLIIIDSASKNEKAVFSIVSYKKGKYISYSPLLYELGFKHHKNEYSLYVTYCAGRFKVYIMDNIRIELERKGVRMPRWWNSVEQGQQII